MRMCSAVRLQGERPHLTPAGLMGYTDSRTLLRREPVRGGCWDPANEVHVECFEESPVDAPYNQQSVHAHTTHLHHIAIQEQRLQ